MTVTLTPWRRVALVICTVVFIIGAGTGTSWALWSVNAAATGTATAGTIAITANDSVSTTLAFAAGSAIGPGSTAAAPVTVKNTGSGLPLSYQMALAVTENPTNSVLGDNITYSIWAVSGTAACTPTATPSSVIATGNLGTKAATNIGAARSLAIGGSEILCVKLSGSTSMPNTVQGQSYSATLTFTGSSV
jgi:hypothetical protein